MKNSGISVIIPVYNGQRTIGKCLESILGSDYKDFEVIVVDDGSSDQTREIVSRFPVRLLPLKQNGGAAKARNRGAEESKGGILLFVDSDVYVKKGALNLVSKAFRNKNLTAIIGTYSRFPESKKFASIFHNLFQCYYFFYMHKSKPGYNNNFPNFWTGFAAIAKDAFLKIGKFDERLRGVEAEDLDFGYRLHKKGYRIALDPRIEVRHDHSYTLLDLLEHDFIRTYYSIKVVLKYQNILPRSKSHTNIINLLSLLLSFMFFGSLLAAFAKGFYLLPLLFLILFSLININFIILLLNTKGAIFTIFALLFYILTFLPIGAGLMAGAIKKYLGGFYERAKKPQTN